MRVLPGDVCRSKNRKAAVSKKSFLSMTTWLAIKAKTIIDDRHNTAAIKKSRDNNRSHPVFLSAAILQSYKYTRKNIEGYLYRYHHNRYYMKNLFPITVWMALFSCTPFGATSQTPLATQFSQIAQSIKGNVGVYAQVIETGDTAALNGHKRFPMQSVYKFPIAMAVLDQVDKGVFTLEQKIHVTKADYIPQNGISPLRDKYPDGDVDVPLTDLLWYNVSKSDGSACDVLLRILGGTAKADSYVHALGIKEMTIATTEQVQVADELIQYNNWATPAAITRLLHLFQTSKVLSEKSQALLLKLMITSGPGAKRIKGQLPTGTVVAHKTGTSGTQNGLTRATNDAGIITLPNGQHLAITVLISDSPASQEERELTIARIARAAWDHWAR